VVVYRAARVIPSLTGEEGDGGGTAGAPPRVALSYGEKSREGGLVFCRCRVELLRNGLLGSPPR